jgi:hypothetical protein
VISATLSSRSFSYLTANRPVLDRQSIHRVIPGAIESQEFESSGQGSVKILSPLVIPKDASLISSGGLGGDKQQDNDPEAASLWTSGPGVPRIEAAGDLLEHVHLIHMN